MHADIKRLANAATGRAPLSVNNRPEPKLVGLLVKGFLVASAACGALAGLAVVEVATRRWPTGRVA